MTVVFAAGSGGHLYQLRLLARELSTPDDEVIWITDRTAQTDTLLAGEQVRYVELSAPRDVPAVLRVSREVSRIFSNRKISRVYSTGAGVALSAYLQCLLRGIPFTYIESATRVTGLSLTGRVLDRMPRVDRFVQHASLVNKRWALRPSVFESLAVEKRSRGEEGCSVFVTVGANVQFGFDSLFVQLRRILDESWSVYCQYGVSSESAMYFPGSRMLPWAEVVTRTRSADVVICHAGTGSILTTLMEGKVPVVIPREGGAGEHVDDHQLELARLVGSYGLGIVRAPNELTIEDLIQARSLRCVPK